MRNSLAFVLILLGAAALGSSALHAQETGGDTPAEAQAAPRAAPTYSLPPGNRVDPEPQVQGPRIPGEVAPRVIRRDPPRASQAEPQPAASRTPDETPVERDTTARREVERDADRDAGRETEREADRRADRDEESTAPSDDAEEPGGEERTAGTDVRDGEEAAPVAPELRVNVDDGLPEEPGSWTPWLLALLAVGAGAAFFLYRRGRAVPAHAADVAGEVAMPQPAPRAAPEPEEPFDLPAASAIREAPPPPAALADLEIDLEPLAARLTLIGLTVGYRLAVRNVGDGAASDIAVFIAIRSAEGAPRPPRGPEVKASLKIEQVGAMSFTECQGDIRLDREQCKALEIDGRALLVPIIDVILRYRDADGGRRETSAAFLVGQERTPPEPKMAPFRLDRGPAQYGAVGGRRIVEPA